MENKASSVKKSVFSNKRFKYGGYALIITLVGIAVVVLLNIGLTTLENNFDLRIDTTQNKKYSLTDQTKQVVQSLSKDIYIYTTYPTGNEDKDISEILQKFKSLSTRIHLENKDTDKDPRFATPYTKDGKTISPGDIIVTDKDSKVFRVLDQYAQYQAIYDQTTGEQTGTQIKVEGSLVTALNYINLGYMPAAYLVQGHGELALSDVSAVSAYMSDSNYNLQTVNVAQTPDKLKAGDIIMFFYPKTDISDQERDILKPLMEKGGRFFFLLDPATMAQKDMPNLKSLLKLYDIELKSGVVVEGDTAHMIMATNPLYLMPDIQSHAITDAMTNKNIPLVLYASSALKLPDVAPDSSTTITSLLKSSDKAFLKKLDPNNQNATMEYQSGDEMGPFDLAAAVEKKNGSNDADSVKLMIAYSTQFITDSSMVSNTNNMGFFLSGCDWMRNADNEIYVRPKLASTAYFTTNVAETWVVIAFSVLFVPVLMLVAGIIIYVRRKHL